MSGKGQSPAGQTTNTSAPLPYLQPAIGTALSQAGSNLGNTPQYYPGQQVASFNKIQNQAFKNTNNIDNTLAQGQGNPFENAMFTQAAQAMQPQLASQFAGSGRDIVGSMPLASQQLNNLATNFYGQNYQNTAQNAMQAANQQQQLGGQIQNQSQNLINADMNKYNYFQTSPERQLGQFESSLGPLMGGGTQSSPYFTNPGANALGMGLGAEQLYNGAGGGGGKKGGGQTFGGGVNSITNDGSSLSNMTPIQSP